MADQGQSFRNHARIVPIYHMGVFFPFALNLFWAIYRLLKGVNGESVIGLFMAIAFLLLFFSVRVQILTVQDRVIRLEMKLRLRQVLPTDLAARIDDLSLQHLVALRFASDGELPDLIRDVLAGRLTTQKAIKAQVKDWQADFQRA